MSTKSKAIGIDLVQPILALVFTKTANVKLLLMTKEIELQHHM